MVSARHQDLIDGTEAAMSMLEWMSWKLKRVCSSSLSAECQAMAEALDDMNCVRLLLGAACSRGGTLKVDQG